MPIGEILRNARMEKGYSFEYLEEATKIRAKYLEALENERFDILPGTVYAKAFLRTYAKYLELNTEEILSEFNNRQNEAPIPAEEFKEPDDNPVVGGSKRWRYMVAGFAIVALLALNSFYNIGNRTEDKLELPKTVQEQPNANSSGNNQQTPEVVEQQSEDGVRVVLKVTDNESWMQVVADGNTVFSGMVAPGEMKDFKAQERIYLHVGNAGAVEVNVNGKDLGRLGEKGKVVKIPFTVGEEPKLTQG